MISFQESNSSHVMHCHDDALVVTIKVNEFNIKRVLIDMCNSTKILFHYAFLRMGVPTSTLHTTLTPQASFTRQSIIHKGILSLPIAFGKDNQQVTLRSS